MVELTSYTAATLATEGHIYCAGSLGQCLHRWNRLPDEKRTDVFLKIGRDGVPSTIIRGEALRDLAARKDLLNSVAR